MYKAYSTMRCHTIIFYIFKNIIIRMLLPFSNPWNIYDVMLSGEFRISQIINPSNGLIYNHIGRHEGKKNPDSWAKQLYIVLFINHGILMLILCHVVATLNYRIVRIYNIFPLIYY